MDAPRYLVSARKYRPQTFAALVAQEHVAETLRNAVRSGRLAQAYLFSGPRGVGKTTAARILAKAVNCLTPVADRPEAEPCGVCDACTSFDAGRSMNVIEIDAASHNGVDDMRELRETVRIPPQGARKKVYILDEVHMLSASAFNAILKTLEEPPEHALFIFATTEPHKVLPTILSRTQRFDFRRIAVPEIVGQLQTICREEGVSADDDALVLVARRGDGAMRDALSVFDQAVALCGTTLTGPALRAALGIVEEDLLFDAGERAAAGDRAGLIRLVDGVVRRGLDLKEFLLGVSEHVRNLLVARATGDGRLIEGTLQTRERYVDAAGAWAEADLLHLLLIADEAVEALRTSQQPRLTVEIALLRMASLEKAADLQRLLVHLDGLARRAAADGGAAQTPVAPAVVAPAAPAVAVAPPPPVEATRVADVATRPPALPRPAEAHTPTPRADTPRAEPTRAEAPRAEPVRAEAPRPGPPAGVPMPDEEHANRPTFSSEPPAAYDAPPHGAYASRAEALNPERTAPSDPPRPAPPPDTDGGVPSDIAPRPTPPAPTPAAAPAAPSPAGGIPGLFSRPALSKPGRPGPSGDGHTGPAPHVGAASVADPFAASLGRTREAWPAVVAALRAEQRIRLASVLQSATVTRVFNGAVEVALADAFAAAVAAENTAGVHAALSGVLGEAAPPLRFVVGERTAREPAGSADPFERLKAMRHEHPVVRALFDRFGAEIVYQ